MAGELRAVGLSKRYGRDRPVLDTLDVTLEPGGVTGVIGGNGSGKSTLLRILAGVGVPSSGRVFGRPQTVAIVPERFVPPGNLSAAAYVTGLGRMRGLRSSTARGAAAAFLDRLGLEPGPDVPMKLLSKGNSQKVAIAQAFLVPAGLIVLDEPRTGLDPAAEAMLDELVDAARARGALVVVSGHADTLRADRLLTLAGGRLSEGERRAPTAPLALVRLRAGTAADRTLAARLPGETTERGDELAVRLPAERVDAALRLALDAGWSVTEVGRTGGVA